MMITIILHKNKILANMNEKSFFFLAVTKLTRVVKINVNHSSSIGPVLPKIL